MLGLDKAIVADIKKITIADVSDCSKAFIDSETRGGAYPPALHKTQHNFACHASISEGISDLLDAWHQGFYRFGPYNAAEILRSVQQHHGELQGLRAQNIRGVRLDDSFEDRVRPIFGALLDATASKNRRFTRRTVTGTSKALGLLAPGLFPMCDEAISQAYDCWWVYSDFGFLEYMRFMRYMKILAEKLVADYSREHNIAHPDQAETLLVADIKAYSGDPWNYSKALLKVIDEYNYARYTKKWCHQGSGF